ncbi:MAG: DUF447 family protein [Thermococci archaeon]|nr:DUF447 family protein [Thermococci archaeon]
MPAGFEDAACLEPFDEGKVFEVVLSSGTNMTPVGVIRRGDTLKFRLFPGRSMYEIETGGRAVIQIVRDVELLVRLALNLPVNVDRDRVEGIEVIAGEPWVLGRVEGHPGVVDDEIGRSRVLDCTFYPLMCSRDFRVSRPVSRADLYLLEMGVDVTRFMEAVRRNNTKEAERLKNRILKAYDRYRRFGGMSEVALHIVHLVLGDTKV